MQDDKSHHKHKRGSSPGEEPRQEFDQAGKGLRTIQQALEDTITSHDADPRGHQAAAPQPEPPPPENEGNLQDEGGEAG